jgi:hypothetical protein
MLKHVLEQQFMEKKNNLVSVLQLSVLVFRNYRVNILMMYPISHSEVDERTGASVKKCPN